MNDTKQGITPSETSVAAATGSADLPLQYQPTLKTCVHACLAMAMGVPVDRVLAVFGSAPMGHDDLMSALRACGLLHVQLASPNLVIHGWHFAVVPSLNIRGGNHQVLIHNDMDGGGISVRDPSTLETYAADGRNLTSWTDLVYFHPGGRLPNT